MSPPVALTIAGSDSGAGAGIQADLKAYAALGVFGTTAITALTAQNTQGVYGVLPVAAAFIGQQIDVVAADFLIKATKTGMLGSREVVEIVVAKVQEHRLTPLVVDPVLRASTGASLLDPDALAALRDRLLAVTTVVTPNLSEAEALCGRPARSLAEMREAARRIGALGPSYVVVKGGHLPATDEATDIVFDGAAFIELRAPRLHVSHTHGTGCTFAAAIAAGLAWGLTPEAAIQQAKDVVTAAIRGGHDLGRGAGPVDSLAYRLCS